LLTREPFHLVDLSLLRFYAKMITHLSTWMHDLQAMLPPDPTKLRPTLDEDHLTLHLSEVALAVLDGWVTRVEAARADEHAIAEFCSALSEVEGLLEGLRGHLKKAQGQAVWLLQEARRLETAGRRIHGRAAPSGTKVVVPTILPAEPPPALPPALPGLGD